MEVEVTNLWPTPIWRSHIGRCISEEELEAVQNIPMIENKRNLVSLSKTILNEPSFNSVKEFAQKSLNAYYKDIILASDTVEPVITNSWLNVSNKGASHHIHFHPNSVVSGVFYLRANDDDEIKFDNLSYPFIEFSSGEFNEFTAATSTFYPIDGEIILFPSKVIHQVPEVKGDKTRISLSFNSFPSGTWGCMPLANQIDLTINPIQN